MYVSFVVCGKQEPGVPEHFPFQHVVLSLLMESVVPSSRGIIRKGFVSVVNMDRLM